MHNRFLLPTISSLLLLIVIFIGACKRVQSTQSEITQPASPTSYVEGQTQIATSAIAYPQPTNEIPYIPTEQPYPGFIPTSELPYPQPTGQIGYPNPEITSPSPYPTPLPSATQPPTLVSQASQTQTIKPATPTVTETVVPPSPSPTSSPSPTPGDTPQYPGPQFTDTPILYPGPEFTDTELPYPGPATSTPRATRTPAKSITPTPTGGATQAPSFTPTEGFGTPLVTPTELPPKPPLSPPPAGSSVTIWHSWSGAEIDTLKSIIQSFQRLYPGVTFSLVYVPTDDLLKTYQEATYLGGGPSLLLGPAAWGPGLFDQELISDLNPYVPPNYLTNINSSALDSGKYLASLISLPLSQHGLVMFRNTSIITKSPNSFDELLSLSHQATHGGVVGSYLERGANFSAANIIGLGGRLMDKDGKPAFNDLFGLAWINLLKAYDDAGAVTFNTNRDLNMFMRGRVGIIIDGSWNISLLAQAIGSDHLAIDPWPTYATGHMSGWVEADSVFLNVNTSVKNRFAALSFMGYLLDPNVQLRLAEVGHIPSVIATQPRDPLILQAMKAFSDGVPYPIIIDNNILKKYWDELDQAIQHILGQGVNPATALQTASDDLTQMLKDIRIAP